MKNKIFNLFRWIGKNKIFCLLFFLNLFFVFLLVYDLFDVMMTRDMRGKVGDFYLYTKRLLLTMLIPIVISCLSGCLYFKKHKILAYILLLPIGGVVFWSLLVLFFYECFSINLPLFWYS